jgi:hypothetical protein
LFPVHGRSIIRNGGAVDGSGGGLDDDDGIKYG